MVLAIFAGGFYAIRVATPMYRSTAVIALDAQEQQVITDIESVLTGAGSDTTSLNTETIVLQSRNLLGRVVDELDLVNDPEFNSRLRERSPYSLGAVISYVAGPTTAPPPTDTDIRNAVIDQLIDRLKITNTRQSLVLEIRSETVNPYKSALISNTLAESYIDDQLRVKIDANERATAVLSERAAALRQTLE